MAKKSDYIELTKAQKEEIRRLTQLANRRIKQAQKVYAKEGMDVAPQEVAGKHQIKEQWHTDTTPMSRSVKFTSQKEYRQQLNYLRSFEQSRPNMTEYTTIQQDKTLDAIKSALGVDTVPDEIVSKLYKMTAPQLSKFWKVFSDKASKMGMKYSSDAVMLATMNEFFPEDMLKFNTLTREFDLGA